MPGRSFASSRAMVHGLITSSAILRTGLAFVAATSLVAHSDPEKGMSSPHAVGAVVLFTVLFFALLKPVWPWATQQVKRLSRVMKWVQLGSFALAGWFLTYAIPVPLAPTPMVDVRVEVLDAGGTDPMTTRIRFRIDVDGQPVPGAAITHGSDWRFEEGYLIAQSLRATASWRGRSSAQATMALASSGPGHVRVTLNGRKQEVAFTATGKRDPVLIQMHALRDIISIFAPERAPVQRIVQAFDAILIGTALWALFLMLSARPGRVHVTAGRRLPATLMFALPSLTVSMYLLLVFGPAIMSSDSLDQWQQATLGHYHDWHPAYHSLAIHLLRQIWDSPTWIALCQATLLAVSTGWLIAAVRAATSASRVAGWIAAWSCALLPVIALTSITLWKDVPYTAAIVAITAACVEVFLNRRCKLSRASVFTAAFVVIVGCMVLRHNGPPVAIAAIAALAILVKEQRRALVVLGVSSIVAFALLKGPVSNAIGVTKTNVTYMPYAHHIAGHLRYGYLPADPADVALLKQVAGPLDQWPYMCASVNPTIFRPEFNGAVAGAHKLDLLRIWLELARRHPGVEVQHVACVGGLVWRVTNNAPMDPLYHYSTAIWGHDGRISWVEPNSLGLHESTMFPDEAQELGLWFTTLDYDLLWRPAIYLYLFLFAVGVAMRRMEDWRIAIVALPLVAHSAVLLLANVAQDVRYQLVAFVIALATAPLLLRASPTVLPSAPDENHGES